MPLDMREERVAAASGHPEAQARVLTRGQFVYLYIGDSYVRMTREQSGVLTERLIKAGIFAQRWER